VEVWVALTVHMGNHVDRGVPSTDMAMSVPWSASNPRAKICSAFPPPACYAITTPGTRESSPCENSCGLSRMSTAGIVAEDTAEKPRSASTVTGSMATLVSRSRKVAEERFSAMVRVSGANPSRRAAR
jgi:hypothetical protein